ncbi:MAG: CHAP domain-containing protein, partial [Acidimicrobiales bacterium]
MILPGGCWLGGQGVNVISNGGVGTDGPYQCVDLIYRLYVAHGWAPTSWQPGNGNQVWSNHPSGLISQPQGSITYVGPGDAISMNVDYNGRQDGADGHVAVVNTVTANSNGTYGLQLVNENAYAVYTHGTWNPATKKVTIDADGFSTYPVVGVLHAPNRLVFIKTKNSGTPYVQVFATSESSGFKTFVIDSSSGFSDT